MKGNNKNYHLAVIVILWIILVLNVLSFGKKDSARNLETVKVGWVENMQAVQELYKSESYKAQQSAAIDQALAQINMAVDPDILEPADTEEDINVEDIEINEEDVVVEDENANNDMIAALEDIKSSTAIHGDENARFTIIEYSELLCPYCKRQSDNGTINAVIEKYPGEVNSVYRNFIVHGAAAKLGEAIECVWELWSDKDYFEFVEEAFAHDGALDMDVLSDIADDIGIKEKAFEDCLEEGRYTATVNNQTSEGRSLFGVNGTPGNVIVDKVTGKFVLIPGAYPAEKFIEEIEKMKAE